MGFMLNLLVLHFSENPGPWTYQSLPVDRGRILSSLSIPLRLNATLVDQVCVTPKLVRSAEK